MSKEGFNSNNITPEDEKNMDNLAEQAKDILGQKNYSNESNDKELEDESDLPSKEEIESEINELTNQLLDDKSDFLTTTQKGSIGEIFFRILIKELPELGLSISDTEEEAFRGTGFLSVKTQPFKTDRHFIYELMFDDPVISYIDHVRPYKEDEAEGKEL